MDDITKSLYEIPTYLRTEWEDHIVDPLDGEIFQQGTPISARNLNKMEQGIYDALRYITLMCKDYTEITDALNNNEISIKRLFSLIDKFFRQAMTGDIQNYIDWASEFPHIGYVRVQPLFLGANTVRVLIVDDDLQPASQTLVDIFQFYLDPNSAGLGNGAAPIGACVTVVAGVGKLISISVTLRLTIGYDNPEGIQRIVNHYITHDASINGYIDHDEMLAELCNIPSIAAVLDFKLNDGVRKIDLADNEIPIIDSLSLEVV